jgi:hypothetical protein
MNISYKFPAKVFREFVSRSPVSVAKAKQFLPKNTRFPAIL